MSMDIYAGPLVRYYIGLWESQLQAYCREEGKTYQSISFADGPTSEENQEKCTTEDTIAAIKIWMKNLSSSFGCNIEWDENIDTPYFTVQFSEFSEFAMLNYYTLDSDSNVIDRFPEEVDLLRHPIAKKAQDNKNFIFLNDLEFFIPIDLPGSGIFKIELPNEREVTCSSTGKLLEELENLSQKIWKISLSDLNSLEEERVIDDLAQNKESLTMAIFGICKLYESALFSQKNKLPIIFDY